ncbi:MAG: carbohydrate ABC transporter permease, partial [Christensenella sp.]
FGGFAFATMQIPFKKSIYFVLILLMLMPIQVMLIPNYIVLDKMKVLGTYWALILPAVFSPFGTFLLSQIFKGIPNIIAEAAKLDGANSVQILLRIFAPASKSGIISLAVLTFIDAWNMVEQPLIYLSNTTQYPLSVFLSSVNMMNFAVSFACAILSMLPVALMFLYFNQELIEGIEFSGIK